jgi:hypothetical protein
MSAPSSLVPPLPNGGRCFVCFPPPLPTEFQNDCNGEPDIRAACFMSGVAYALVILSYVKEEGDGLCAVHKPLFVKVLDTIENVLDELVKDGVIPDVEISYELGPAVPAVKPVLS